jgi:hypothetical protein
VVDEKLALEKPDAYLAVEGFYLAARCDLGSTVLGALGSTCLPKPHHQNDILPVYISETEVAPW